MKIGLGPHISTDKIPQNTWAFTLWRHFNCLVCTISKNSHVKKKVWPTDRRTDGRTDIPSYRDARTHLKRLNDNVFFAGILRQNTQNKRPQFDFKLICIQLILNHPLWKARGPLRLVLSMILIAVYHDHTRSRLHPKPRESLATETMKNIRLICIIPFQRKSYTWF